MSEINCVPPPVLLNCLKHHLNYIKDFIENIAKQQAISQLPAKLLCLGESQMDIYTGDISPASIAAQIIAILKDIHCFEKPLYTAWLHQQSSSYATIQVADGTNWVLRAGEHNDRYIHTHPGRYATHTFRIRASALKTAIALSIWQRMHPDDDLTLQAINQTRQQLLQLPPVKSIQNIEAISKLLYLLNNKPVL